MTWLRYKCSHTNPVTPILYLPKDVKERLRTELNSSEVGAGTTLRGTPAPTEGRVSLPGLTKGSIARSLSAERAPHANGLPTWREPEALGWLYVTVAGSARVRMWTCIATQHSMLLSFTSRERGYSVWGEFETLNV